PPVGVRSGAQQPRRGQVVPDVSAAVRLGGGLFPLILSARTSVTASNPGPGVLAGKPSFTDTVITADLGIRRQLAAWMHARDEERREQIWLREAGPPTPCCGRMSADDVR